MKVRVPLVNIFTPQFVSIRLYVPYTNKRVASTVPFLNTLKPLGLARGITRFSRTQDRAVTTIYGFNGDEMQPVWVIPGQMSTTVQLHSIIFHDTDLLRQLGFIHGNLLTQENPFVIVEEQYTLRPTLSFKEFSFESLTRSSSSTTTEFESTYARAIFYHDCWLTSNPVTYDIMGDLILIPEVKVTVGRIETSEEKFNTLFQEAIDSFTKTVTTWINRQSK